MFFKLVQRSISSCAFDSVEGEEVCTFSSVEGYITENIEQVLNYMRSRRRGVSEISCFHDLLVDNKVGLLKNLFVDELSRREGFGSQLVREFIEECEKHKVNFIVLEVDTSEINDFSLEEWYKSFGFIKTQEQGDKYPLMVKRLRA